MELGILAGDRKQVHLSRTIANALEAGQVRIDRPRIIEVDTVRAIADGHTIHRAGTTVFLTEKVPAEYLYAVEEDDPAILEVIARWDEEEEGAQSTFAPQFQQKSKSGSSAELHLTQRSPPMDEASLALAPSKSSVARGRVLRTVRISSPMACRA